jgi:tetratricopeptide (TPR) repeat protein
MCPAVKRNLQAARPSNTVRDAGAPTDGRTLLRLPRSPSSALKTAKTLLESRGVVTANGELEGDRVLYISLTGEHPLNKLAQGIFKNHHKVRMGFDPARLYRESDRAFFSPEELFFCLPWEYVLNEKSLVGRTIVAHELGHIKRNTIFLNGGKSSALGGLQVEWAPSRLDDLTIKAKCSVFDDPEINVEDVSRMVRHLQTPGLIHQGREWQQYAKETKDFCNVGLRHAVTTLQALHQARRALSRTPVLFEISKTSPVEVVEATTYLVDHDFAVRALTLPLYDATSSTDPRIPALIERQIEEQVAQSLEQIRFFLGLSIDYKKLTAKILPPQDDTVAKNLATYGIIVGNLTQQAQLSHLPICYVTGERSTPINIAAERFESKSPQECLQMLLALQHISATPEQIRRIMNVVIESFYDNDSLLVKIAHCAREMQMFDIAEKCYSQVRALPHRSAITNNDIALWLLRHQSNPDSAYPFAKEAAEDSPHEPCILETLGAVELARGHVTNAKKILLKAYRLVTEGEEREPASEAEISFRLGETFRREGNRSHAVRYLLRALHTYTSLPADEQQEIVFDGKIPNICAVLSTLGRVEKSKRPGDSTCS